MTEHDRPAAKDLAIEEPRPMDDQLGGYPWLPRILDKARASRAGTLGTYYRYPCPIDQAFLAELGVGATEFAELAEAATDDEALTRLSRLGARPATEFRFDPEAMNSDLHAEASSNAGS